MCEREVLNGIRKVGVIGAGAAGLVAARELKREGFEVVIYEQNADVGGIWLYNPKVGDDPLGLDLTGPNQGTIYDSLRTNVARELMGFMDYPFPVKEGRDPRRFPAHHELFLYLKDFARDFNLVESIRFNTRVEYVGMLQEGEGGGGGGGEEDRDMDGDPMDDRVQWVVRARGDSGAVEQEVFDAVVVCNGHYRQPNIPEIPGAHNWPGKQLHSFNYRIPEPFSNQVVVIIGKSSSACDISLDLKKLAKEVHLSTRSTEQEKEAQSNEQDKDTQLHIDLHRFNVHLHPMISYLDEDGTVVFQDGSTIIADSIIYCTGYSYSIPFLQTKGIVTVENNCVGPLYEHIFPPLLAPSLSFVGIPQKVLTFPFFHLQSKWITSVLARKVKLPSRRDMIRLVKELYDYHMEMSRFSKRLVHDIGNFEYYDQLADKSGTTHLEEWKKDMATKNIKLYISYPEMFRELWNEDYPLELMDKLPKTLNN